nr:MAG TPA: transmembrane protein [Caudoviricetes sp.]
MKIESKHALFLFAFIFVHIMNHKYIKGGNSK